MKCAFLTGVKQFQIQEIPDPVRRPQEVLVRVKAAGICRSDIHYYEEGRIGAEKSRFPQRLGHESAGVVEQSPPDSGFKPGERVAIEPGRPCFDCEHCRNGHYHLCPQVQFFGSPGMQGAFAEYVLVDPRQIVRLPEMVGLDEGALLEPLGVAFHTLELSALKAGESVAVFGAGSIGLLTLALAKLAGAGETFIFDRLDYRLDLAKKLYGAEHAVNTSAVDPLVYLKKHTNNRGVDVSIEAAGGQETFWWAFEAARIGGRCYLIGIPYGDTVPFDPHTARRRELLVQNVRRSNLSLEPCLRLLEQGRIKIGPLATHHFALEKIADAFETANLYRDGVVKAIVTP